ncbi:hypothetical protein [Salinispora pacifica]|uniref:hypothetical protein n=1 Tax=Salinispora pacifica TaxID=351187 RepID=UPI001EE26D7E|nr:hypothetical protein [Salinispora pacifica]
MIAEVVCVLVCEAADDRRGHRGKWVEAAPDHHVEQALEEGFRKRGQRLAGVGVLVDLRVELSADRMHAGDAHADEESARESKGKVLVVETFTVALGHLRELGSHALPELLEPFLDTFPDQPQQLVPQPHTKKIDQGLYDLLPNFYQCGHGRRAETRGDGEGDLNHLGERGDDDIVLSGFRIQGKLVSRVPEGPRDIPGGRDVVRDAAPELVERVRGGSVQICGEPVAQVGRRRGPVQQVVGEGVELIPHGT